MPENKTRLTAASVEDYLSAIADEERRQNCRTLVKLMTKASKHRPKMWGTAIVGFGSYHYRYESGREGDMCLVGFSSRKGDISIYGLNAAPDHAQLLARLGKHKAGKGCLYVRRLDDIDAKVLERLVASAVAAKRDSAPSKSPA